MSAPTQPFIPRLGTTMQMKTVYGWIRVLAMLALAYWLFLKFASSPGPFGDRGDTPQWGPRLGLQPAVRSMSETVPLVFVQLQSLELPATTVGKWWRHHSL